MISEGSRRTRAEVPVFPVARWVALAWLVVYVPSYAWAYGLMNFLFLCNLSVMITCVGVVRGSPLLLSSQAVSAVVVDGTWILDFSSRLLLGHHWIGGTAYMWDAQWPLFARLLSVYHLVLPVFLVLAVRRVGYDSRGIGLQSVVALAAMAGGWWAGPEANVNFAHVDPFLYRSWGPPAIHVAFLWLCLVGGAYWPTHLILRRLFGSHRGSRLTL